MSNSAIGNANTAYLERSRLSNQLPPKEFLFHPKGQAKWLDLL